MSQVVEQVGSPECHNTQHYADHNNYTSTTARHKTFIRHQFNVLTSSHGRQLIEHIVKSKTNFIVQKITGIAGFKMTINQ